jgi:tellurite resistance protein TerC
LRALSIDGSSRARLLPFQVLAFPITPLLAITGSDLADAIPVILSLIVIEGLLSVDNALAIAAMASHLPGKQKILALRLGIIGAYVFRGIALALAGFIIKYWWLKLIGAAYLIHLMCTHFAGRSQRDVDPNAMAGKGLVATIIGIELMDLSLSIDNVVVAVAMSPKLWVVITGVFIGILALRLVAGYAIKLIERYPILEDTAFVLIGYVGALLIIKHFTGVDLHTMGKFIGIVIILAISIYYSRHPAFKRALHPFISASNVIMRAYAAVSGAILAVIAYPFKAIVRLFRPSRPAADEAG